MVHLSASTGVCAVRLSGYASTAHSSFAIPVDDGGRIEPLSPKNPKFQALMDADVFIVDEYSMLTATVLNHILYRIQQVHWSTRKDKEEYTDALSTKTIILVGDHCQLPPVCRHRTNEDEICHQCHISASAHWAKVQMHHLSISMRHATDPEFSAFLTHVRETAHISPERIHQCLYDWVEYKDVPPPVGHQGPSNRVPVGQRSCEIKAEDILHLADERTTVLCTHRHQVKAVNNMLFDKFFPDPASHVALPVKMSYSSTPPGEDLDLEIKLWFEDEHFSEIEKVAIGARVMITDNSHLAKGVCNGATGVVTGFKYKTADRTEIMSGDKDPL